MNQQLRDALHAEYEHAHDTIRPDGVAAVHAGAARKRRRALLTAGAVVVALAVTASWRLMPGSGPTGPADSTGPATPAQARPGCDRPGFDVAVFLKYGSTAEQAERIDRTLRDSPEVFCLVFETREQAWERFKVQFADAPDLVAATTVDSLPESFRFRVSQAPEAHAVGQRVGGLDGVSDYLCSCLSVTPTRR
ncbi:permease-like cell division protein FtsX [Dactylosporangium sp. NPDC000521]|uniref:permease-like cell division protein FtsX n=1 Tax=Dactylosporangium sp. NPDC000521 TaxID=3363975 RepID=UPI0036C1D682